MKDEAELRAFASRYEGEGKLQRLIYIAERVGTLAPFCWAIIEEELRAQAERTGTTNTDLFKKSRQERSLPVDCNWMAEIDSQSNLKLEKLQNDLAIAHQNVQRAAVREILMEIGTLHAQRGCFTEALKSFYRCREYTSTPEQVIDMCMNIIKIQCATNNANRAQTYLNKAETSILADDRVTAAQLKAASGLVFLANNSYKTAAHKFLEVNLCLGTSFCDVLLPEDAAVYGVICALASFSRHELKSVLLDNKEFRNFLELTPRLHKLVQHFYQCQYSTCLSFLNEWREEARLDLFIGQHVEHLVTEVRSRALVQYFTPYMSVSMVTMADVFHTSVNQLEKELLQLIMKGKIEARIDSQNKVLLSVSDDQRTTTFRKALKMGEEHQEGMAAFIMRANLIKNKVMVESFERSSRSGHTFAS